jgi:hypothetical protein
MIINVHGLRDIYAWDIDARIIVMVGPRKGYQFAGTRNSRTISAYRKLGTRWVELGTAHLGGKMESNDFMADEISTRSDIGR